MTWTRVLVATDLSSESTRAADACLDLPGSPTLLLVYAADPGDDPSGALEVEAKRLERLGAVVDVRVVGRGRRTIAHALLEAAAGEGADLITVGARGRGRALDRLLGSVSEGVLRGARTDVLIFREWRSAPVFARPLLPIDLSATSIETAERLAATGGPKTGVLLHVGAAAPAELASLAARIGLDPLIRTGATVPAIIEAAIEVQATVIALSRVGSADVAAGVTLGHVAEGVALGAPCPVLVACPSMALAVAVRELSAAEFPLADEVWRVYHETQGDPTVDRIFGLFLDGTLASLARCRRHPDGYEVDAVFTPPPLRGRGYARRVMAALVEACHNEDLLMYAVAGLEPFYGGFGFMAIPESRLPPTIRARYEWAGGDMQAAEVTPMMRPAGWYGRNECRLQPAASSGPGPHS
jgi:nucleotide-binding universal stress UspA family protein/predicted GNAT family acetyltransferase